MNTKVMLAAAAMATIFVLISLDALRGFMVNHEGPSRLEVLPLLGVTGPESLTIDANGGGRYTDVSDGRIIKWEAEHRRSNECRGSQDPKLEHVCGRPLGLQFNKRTGDLYIADAYLGLLMVGPNSTFATPVSTQVQHLPFGFTNSLDIDQDSGVIYFTDSSTRFQRREFMSAIITGDKTGRVMKYDPKSKETQVLLDGLSFPNGLVLSANSSSLLIAESTTCRILRYRLQDTKPARFEVLAQLPGFPDNIKHSPRGGFWVALYSRRGSFLRWILSLPWLGELLLRTPLDVQRLASFVSSWRGQALALRLSEEGEVLEVLEGFGGKNMRFISEVEEHNGNLWIGSVIMPFVGLYKL